LTAEKAQALTAIVPVAGAGTRLRPHTHTTPKALLYVAGRPILAHILDDLLALGVRKLVMVVGHMGERIREYVDARYASTGLSVSYAEQKEPQGLGHAIHLAAPLVKGGPVLILLGDTIFRADFSKLVSGGASAIGVKAVDDPRRFGVVEVEGGRVKRLVEKPDVPPSHLAIVGVYYLEDGKPLFDALDELVRRDIRTRGEYQLTDALQLVIDHGTEIRPFPVEGWYDCGKTETLLETNRQLLELQGGAPTVPGSVVLPPVAIEPGAEIVNSVIGPHVSIATGAVVKNCVVRNSIINPNARVVDILLQESLVGENAVAQGVFQSLNVGDSSEVRFL
jgi:glucose-1-phosphate thymidylyltransferase